MSEWWTYDLSDFLLFSHRVYLRLFELHNTATWPAQVATLMIGAAILFAAVKPHPLARRLVPLILGVIWLWVAWAFFGVRYATINWAAPHVAVVFALQGVALCAIGIGPGLALAADQHRTTTGRAGLLMLAVGVLFYPLIAPALGRPVAAAEFFGIAPDPTAIATLAILSLSAGSARWLLMVVPLLWSLTTGLTLWTMGAAEAFVAPVCALICIVVIARRAVAS